MIRTIDQGNLYLLLPSKVCRLAELLAEREGLNAVEAVERIYASDTYRRLEEEASKAWHLGPVALYECMREEPAGQQSRGREKG